MFPPLEDIYAREEGTILSPRFNEQGLITAVATDAVSGEVLMVAHMNAEALQRTLATGEAHYWSRSRQALWHKGATSGCPQHVIEMRLDCDQDCIWLRVESAAPGQCHVGYRSCFYRRIEKDGKLTVVADKTYDPATVYGSKKSVNSPG